MDLFSGDGVLELKKLGVQEISSIAGEAGEIFKGLAVRAVQRIADQRMADGCQMDSDLMRAARIEAYLKGCDAWAACDHLCQGLGRFANRASGPHGTEARVRHEADGREDFVGVVLGNVLSQRAVDFLDFGCVPVCE